MKEEIFKDIPGYEGLYKVSNFGNVKSLFIKGNNRDRILKPSLAKGYRLVILCNDNNRKGIKVHQLVAMAFLGHVPNGMIHMVHHKDENKENNNLTNLEIVDNRTNVILSKKNKYTGAYYCKDWNRWTARIRIGNKNVYLGSFKSGEETSNIYKLALKNIELYNGDVKEFKELLKNK